MSVFDVPLFNYCKSRSEILQCRASLPTTVNNMGAEISQLVERPTEKPDAMMARVF